MEFTKMEIEKAEIWRKKLNRFWKIIMKQFQGSHWRYKEKIIIISEIF